MSRIADNRAKRNRHHRQIAACAADHAIGLFPISYSRSSRGYSASLRLPVHHDLARLTAAHDVERVLIVRIGHAMRDDGTDVQAALQERGHLVPGLEHLAAVDAFDRESLQDHLIPVDRHFRSAGCRAWRCCRRDASCAACRAAPRHCLTSPGRHRSLPAFRVASSHRRENRA